MATRTLSTPEPFSRIVDERPTNSWRAAIPAAVIVIGAVIAAAYFAAKASEQSQLLAGTRTEMTQNTQALAQIQARAATLEGDLTRLRTAGRTTVILKPAAAKASRKGADTAASSSWGAATWGEASDGKTWVRMDAYGLAQPPQGKTYQLWFEGTGGSPVSIAKLDPAQDGSAFAEGKDLPGVDQGKRLFVSLDDEEAKKPGTEVFQAELPKLKPMASASPQPGTAQQPAQAGAAAGQGQGAGEGAKQQ
jgi:anti-sigma-K factor RskA